MQNIANQLPNAFIDAKKVTKSHIPVANVPSKIDIPTQQVVTNESGTRQKRGRPVGSKDKNPRKRKINDNKKDLVGDVNIHEETLDMTNNTISEEGEIPKDNNEISINYVMTGKRWNRTHVIIDNIFAYNVALDIISENEDPEPKSVEECRHRND